MDFQKIWGLLYGSFGKKAMEAYDIIIEEDLPDIHALLRKSGTRVMLIPAEDDNKVFNIAFRTRRRIQPVLPILLNTLYFAGWEFPLL